MNPHSAVSAGKSDVEKFSRLNLLHAKVREISKGSSCRVFTMMSRWGTQFLNTPPAHHCEERYHATSKSDTGTHRRSSLLSKPLTPAPHVLQTHLAPVSQPC